MKNLFLMFILLGLFAILAPRNAKAIDQDCGYVAIPCGNASPENGWQEYWVFAYVCDLEDWDTWREILC